MRGKIKMNSYYIPQTISSAHFDIHPYDYMPLTFGEKKQGVVAANNFLYSLNNYGHRSEDFKKRTDKLNILFSGCSFTFGESLPYKQNWSGKLYNKIKLKYNVDDYYSLSFLGGSTELIVFNIFMYCKEFGNPDVIFLLIPDSGRKVSWNQDLNQYENYANPNEDEYGRRMSLLRSFYNISMLEQYCFTNKISLIWSSWMDDDCKNFYEKLKSNTFISLNNYKVLSNATNDYEKNDFYYKIGRDKLHPGLHYSDGLANIFYNEFIERYENEENIKKNIIKN